MKHNNINGNTFGDTSLEARLRTERSNGMFTPPDQAAQRVMAAVYAETREHATPRRRQVQRARASWKVGLATLSGMAAAYLIASQLNVFTSGGGSGPTGRGAAAPKVSASSVIGASLRVVPRSSEQLAQATTAPLRRGVEALTPDVRWFGSSGNSRNQGGGGAPSFQGSSLDAAFEATRPA